MIKGGISSVIKLEKKKQWKHKNLKQVLWVKLIWGFLFLSCPTLHYSQYIIHLTALTSWFKQGNKQKGAKTWVAESKQKQNWKFT